MKRFCLLPKPLVLAISVASFGVNIAVAQTQPAYSIGHALQESQPNKPQQAAKQTPVPPLVRRGNESLNIAQGETLQVNAFHLVTDEGVSASVCQAVLNPYRHRALTLADIHQAMSQLSDCYHAQGYPLAKTSLPRQDARNGILTLRIVVGKFGEIEVKNHSRVKDALPKAVFNRLKQQHLVTHSAIERAMLLTYDMPGIEQMPAVTLSRGEAPGSADFLIDVPEGKRYAGYITADNQGSRYTGRNRVSGGIAINSPLGIADKLALDVMDSGEKGLLTGQVAYAFPLSADGLRGQVSYARTTYQLGAEYGSLDASGQANTLQAGLSYPLIRSQSHNIYLTTSLANRHLRDEIAVADQVVRKRVWSGSVALQDEAWNTLFDKSLYTNASFGLTYGHLQLPDNQQAELNRQSADTVGNFAHINFSLLANQALINSLSLVTTFSAQQSLLNKNLDGSEQFNIAGPTAVKAWRESLLGDNGYLLGAELRYQLPAFGKLQQTFGVFSDTGYTSLQNGDYANDSGYRLSDIGVGYYATYQPVSVTLQFAHLLGPKPSQNSHDEAHLLAQMGISF